MHLDIFHDDAFSLSQLTLAINDTPHVPSRLSQLRLFSEEGISTTSVSIERVGTSLAIIPSAERGSVGRPVTSDKRKMISINSVHLPQVGAVNADEVQNLRAFGKETEVETLQTVVNRKLAKARRNIDITLEYHGIGAIKGQVLDSDGSTVLLDIYSTFGLSQQTHDMNLDSDSTKVRLVAIAVKRKIEDALGGLPYTGVRVLCSDTFFDALVGHPAVEKAYTDYLNGQFLREDNRPGFLFADIYWENYRGAVNGSKFITEGKAYAFPEGVPEMFVRYFAPADYNETVNTNGLPYYAKQWPKEGNKGIVLEAQSNPITLNTRPNAVIELSIT